MPHAKGNTTVAINSYIGSDTTIKGSLECSKDFLVEGVVEGSLCSAGSIVLGRGAVVRGEVVAREVVVSGTVIGTIRCSARLEIYRSARILGTVLVPALKMESGAKVHARIIMSNPPEDHQLLSHSPEDYYTSGIADTRRSTLPEGMAQK
jgi:cytoskeletal protein CcmA (bactofilin family)